MAGLGAPEFIIIALVVLLLFGTARLPKLARSIGQASQEFKRGMAEGTSEQRGDVPVEHPTSAPTS